MKRISLGIIFISFFLTLFSQTPYTGVYQSGANPHYWKNRKPFAGYWQQDVAYTIKVKLDTTRNCFGGNLYVNYTNNSPDTLNTLWFHLYQNAYQPESYLEKVAHENRLQPNYGPIQKEKKGTLVSDVKCDGLTSTFEIDNTLMKVVLANPLLPGKHLNVSIQFETFIDPNGLRHRTKAMKETIQREDGTSYEVTHYNVVLWYPRMVVYDMKRRWNLDQHIGKEFYGDFGSFDVEITTPGEYILDGTGVLQNANEVLPGHIRSQLDISRFKDKKWDEPASEIIAQGGPEKTWKLKAVNVHDFGFTADPTYRIGEVEWNGIRAISMARERHASGWQNAADFAMSIIKTYSTDFGMYIWPKIIVADADDGMEYPMMTLDGGRSPSYYGLLAHEIGHMWFYGMVGSNETYRAFMDEGFTQFLTGWCMKKLVGDVKADKKGKIILQQEYVACYLNYLMDAREGYDGHLNTHSNDFHNAMRHENGYRSVYRKTATMLYNLQYVLGNDVFQKAMKNYFSKWYCAHPYPEDFRQAISESAKTDLAWFFDQWLETDKRLDYGICKVKKKNGGKSVEIKIKRKEDMQMPLDLNIKLKNGDSLNYLIPNTAYRKSEPGLNILPQWTGWSEFQRSYTAKIELPDAFKTATIDPSLRLGDIYRLDNTSGCPKHRFLFSLYPKQASRFILSDKYYVNVRPNIWWNAYSGLQLGASISGDYAQFYGKTFFGVWYSSGIGNDITYNDTLLALYANDYHKLNYSFTYQTPLQKLNRNAELNLRTAFRDGLWLNEIGFSQKNAIGRKNNPRYSAFSGAIKFMQRNLTQYNNYLIYPNQWNTGPLHMYAKLGFEKGYPVVGGNGKLKTEIRSGGAGNTGAYMLAQVESNYNIEWKKFVIKYRAFARYTEGNIPIESALYLAGGSPEEMYDSEFYRARGFFPDALLENNLGQETSNLHFGGGLNLRGYTGYLAEFDNRFPAWFGNSGASMNLEIEFDRWVPFRPKSLSQTFNFDSYLFADAGFLAQTQSKVNGLDELSIQKLRMDAGLGFALHISEPHFLPNGPLTLRLDLPFWLNRPPYLENFMAPRWVFAIGRAF